jgi:hypothetical protein
MLVLMTVSNAWAASIALVAIFFVAIPALVVSLVLFAAAQSVGERAAYRALRGRRTGVDA